MRHHTLTACHPSGGGGGYTGPLDLTATPAVVAYGQRALSAAKLGSAYATIRRDSDDTTQAFNFGASDGTAPVAAIVSFLGSSTLALGSVAIANGGSGYDDGFTPSTFDATVVGGTFATAAIVNVTTDSGGVVVTINSITSAGSYTAGPASPCATTGDDGVNHGTGLTFTVAFANRGAVTLVHDQGPNAATVVQADSAKQPAWVASAANARPALCFDNAAIQFLATAGNVAIPSSAFTAFVVAQFNGTTAFLPIFGENVNSGDPGYLSLQKRHTALDFDAFDNNTGNEVRFLTNDPVSDGVVVQLAATMTTGTWTALQNGVSLDAADDGSGGNIGNVLNFPFALGGADAAATLGDTMNGFILEALLFNGILPDIEITAISANQKAWYGTP